MLQKTDVHLLFIIRFINRFSKNAFKSSWIFQHFDTELKIYIFFLNFCHHFVYLTVIIFHLEVVYCILMSHMNCSYRTLFISDKLFNSSWSGTSILVTKCKEYCMIVKNESLFWYRRIFILVRVLTILNRRDVELHLKLF